MKKILLISVVLSAHLMAQEFGGEIEVSSIMKIGQDKIMDIEPVGNMTGESSVRYTVKGGFIFRGNNYKSLAYLYYAKMPDKNSQNSIGVGLKVYFNNKFTFSGYAGQGRQSVSGKSFHMNSNLNTRTYVTDTVRYGDYTAVFNNNTEVFEIGADIGHKFKITRSVNLTTNVGFIYSANQLSWTVDGGVMNITADQFQANLGIGLNF